MGNPPTLDMLADRAAYAAHFMDIALWEPHIRQVCSQHGYRFVKVEPGEPGTFPTFMVATGEEMVTQPHDRIVVKFFGPLFDGGGSFDVERDMGYWLATHPLPIASPAILAEGRLNQDWQYLILQHVVGESIKQASDKLSKDDWLCMARQVGAYMLRLHTLTCQHRPELPPSMQPSSEKFTRFLAQQRATCQLNHERWNELPAQLVGHIDSFILPIEQLVDFSSPPHLIHADLTTDHLLGGVGSNGWQTLAIIDWGDAMTGNLLYELVALHMDLFHTDKTSLRACLETYGLPPFFQRDFPRKALSMVLLHQFPMPASVYAPYQSVKSLQELAECLFAL